MCEKCNKQKTHLYETYEAESCRYINVCGDCLPQVVMDNKTAKRIERAEKEKFTSILQDRTC